MAAVLAVDYRLPVQRSVQMVVVLAAAVRLMDLDEMDALPMLLADRNLVLVVIFAAAFVAAKSAAAVLDYYVAHLDFLIVVMVAVAAVVD